MNTYDYIDAVYGNGDFIATPEALVHLALCNANSMLMHQTEMLVRARETYRELPTNKHADSIEMRRRKLRVQCKLVEMLLIAVREFRIARDAEALVAEWDRAAQQFALMEARYN